MWIVNIIIILVFLFGIYRGYQYGIIKELVDLFILFISSFLAGRLSNFLFGILYSFFPFFNFFGKSEGLKSINIILWKLILYLVLITLIVFIMRKILIKTKIEDKIIDSMIETNIISKILGSIISFPLITILIFNILLILLSPNFNIKSIYDSKLASKIMEKTPILSKENINLYNNQKYIIKRINEDDNTIDNYQNVNSDIIQNIINTRLVSEDKIKILEEKNKLVGTRKINNKNKQEEKEESTNPNYDNYEDNDDNYEDNDDNYEEPDGDYEDSNYNDDEDSEQENIDESEVIIEEDNSDGSEEIIDEEQSDDDYCNDFPGDC